MTQASNFRRLPSFRRSDSAATSDKAYELVSPYGLVRMPLGPPHQKFVGRTIGPTAEADIVFPVSELDRTNDVSCPRSGLFQQSYAGP